MTEIDNRRLRQIQAKDTSDQAACEVIDGLAKNYLTRRVQDEGSEGELVLVVEAQLLIPASRCDQDPARDGLTRQRVTMRPIDLCQSYWLNASSDAQLALC